MEESQRNSSEETTNTDTSPQKGGVKKFEDILRILLYLYFGWYVLSRSLGLLGIDLDKKRLLLQPARIDKVTYGEKYKRVTSNPMWIAFESESRIQKPLRDRQYIALVVHGSRDKDGTLSMFISIDMQINMVNKLWLERSLDAEDRNGLVSRAGVEIGKIQHNPDLIFYDQKSNKKAVLHSSSAELTIEQDHIEYVITYPLSDSILTEWPDITYTAIGLSPFTLQGLDPQMKMGYMKPEHFHFQRGLSKRIDRVSKKLKSSSLHEKINQTY